MAFNASCPRLAAPDNASARTGDMLPVALPSHRTPVRLMNARWPDQGLLIVARQKHWQAVRWISRHRGFTHLHPQHKRALTACVPTATTLCVKRRLWLRCGIGAGRRGLGKGGQRQVLTARTRVGAVPYDQSGRGKSPLPPKRDAGRTSRKPLTARAELT